MHSARGWRADRLEQMPGEPAAYAARLYAALHALDDAGCRLIVVEALPDGPGWLALQDRLRRGAFDAEPEERGPD